MTLPYVAQSGCIDSYSCLFVPFHEALNSNARATKQLCNAYYTGSGDHHAKSSYAQYDVNIALSRFIMVALKVDFRCSDSKDSRIVCCLIV